jgi:hypothetical protein
MASAVTFIQWNNYSRGLNGQGLFGSRPLTYNSSQERLHLLRPGDRLWLASRATDDQQYYFVGCLAIAGGQVNPTGSLAEKEFGQFSVAADAALSYDLGKRFPAEGLLRALQFESGKPIKFGASLGQSLQTIRFLSPADEEILDATTQRILRGEEQTLDSPFGLWTKCDGVFADYFWKNWEATGAPLAFLLYDSPPVLTAGAPVFIHSDKNLRLLATFRKSEYLAGHKNTVERPERALERERVWLTYRASTVDPPSKSEFDVFWDRQNGVRALFVMEDLFPIQYPCPFGVYGRGLQWGYPIGVGYRYLTLSQCLLLLRCAAVPPDIQGNYLGGLLRA